MHKDRTQSPSRYVCGPATVSPCLPEPEAPAKWHCSCYVDGELYSLSRQATQPSGLVPCPAILNWRHVPGHSRELGTLNGQKSDLSTLRAPKPCSTPRCRHDFGSPALSSFLPCCWWQVLEGWASGQLRSSGIKGLQARSPQGTMQDQGLPTFGR